MPASQRPPVTLNPPDSASPLRVGADGEGQNSDDDARVRRITQNEVMARYVNEAIEEGNERGREGLNPSFGCECSRSDCREHLVELKPAEYERIRAHHRRFVVSPGHVNTEIETVVEAKVGYVVVEKYGAAGRLAEARDDRR